MVDKNKTILVINPGSTSTKVAIYLDQQEKYYETIDHSTDQLNAACSINDQLGFRIEAVKKFLAKNNISVEQLSGVAARGGMIGELESGAYLINDKLTMLSEEPLLPHASNLGAMIANQITKHTDIPAFIYDAVCSSGKPEEIYVISGLPEIKRIFATHVLNSRAVCIAKARAEGRELEETTYIVTHMGGGISTNLIKGGKIVDVMGDDEGTFSPERSGGIPCRQLVKLCFSGKYSEKEMQNKLKGSGGLMAYLGTNDLNSVSDMIDHGDEEASLVFNAMALQIAKDIGSLSVDVNGKIDKIILTGGMAHSSRLTDAIKNRVEFIAPVDIIKGTYEMEALALGVLRVLNRQEQAHVID